MAKKFYILLIIMFGFFLGPTLNFARGIKTEKKCFKNKTFLKTTCKETDFKTKEYRCANGCIESAADCPVVYCSYYSPMISFQTDNHSFFNFSKEKQNYYYLEIFISSDFRSIWLPPKIS